MDTSFRFDLQCFADGEGGTGGEGAGGEGGTGGEGTTTTKTEKTYTEKYVKQLHYEDAQRRAELEAAKTKLKAHEDEKAAIEKKKLEDEGNYKKVAEDAEKRAAQREKESEKKEAERKLRAIKVLAKAQLVREGIIDEDDIALLDLSSVEWPDDAEDPKGIDAVIKEFKKRKPAKFQAAEGGNNTQGNTRTDTRTASNGGTGKGGGGEDARSWGPEELERRWANTSKV